MIAAFYLRAFSVNLAVLLSYIGFIDILSGSHYPLLTLGVSILSLLVFGLTFFRRHYNASSYNVIQLVLLLFVISSIIASFMGQAGHVFLVVGLAMFAGLNDLVSTSVYPLLIQTNAKPTVCPIYFARYAQADSAGKVFVGVLLLGLSRFELEPLKPYIYSGLAALMVAHFFVFRFSFEPLRPEVNAKPMFERFNRSVYFVRHNSLVRTAIYLIVWVSCLKFMLQFAFYQSADRLTENQEELTAFLSGFDLLSSSISFFLIPVMTSFFVNQVAFSMAFLLLPTVVIIFGVIIILFPSTYLVVALFLVFGLLFKAVHKPMTRQCTVPIPQKIRSDIFMMIATLTTLANFALSGLANWLRPFLDIEMVLMAVVFLSLVAFFIVGRMDSDYLKNLWMFLKEKSGESDLDDLGNWTDASDSAMSYVTLPQYIGAGEIEEDEKALPLFGRKEKEIRTGYVKAITSQQVKKVCREHARAIVKAKSEEEKDELQSLLSIFLDMSPQVSQKALSYWDRELGQTFTEQGYYQERIRPVDDFWTSLNTDHLDLLTRKRLRTYLHQVFARGHYPYLENLRELTQLDRLFVREAVSFLSPLKATTEPYFFECIEDGDFSLGPAFENLDCLSFEEADGLRKMIAEFASFDEPAVNRYMQENLTRLSQKSFALKPGSIRDLETKNFLNCAYFAETTRKPKAVSKMVSSSMLEFASLEGWEWESLYDLHRRFLLKGRFQSYFRRMMPIRGL